MAPKVGCETLFVWTTAQVGMSAPAEEAGGDARVADSPAPGMPRPSSTMSLADTAEEWEVLTGVDQSDLPVDFPGSPALGPGWLAGGCGAGAMFAGHDRPANGSLGHGSLHARMSGCQHALNTGPSRGPRQSPLHAHGQLPCKRARATPL